MTTSAAALDLASRRRIDAFVCQLGAQVAHTAEPCAPYDDPACRTALFILAMALYFSPTPGLGVPAHNLTAILAAGMRDANPDVAAQCHHCMTCLGVALRPRFPGLRADVSRAPPNASLEDDGSADAFAGAYDGEVDGEEDDVMAAGADAEMDVEAEVKVEVEAEVEPKAEPEAEAAPSVSRSIPTIRLTNSAGDAKRPQSSQGAAHDLMGGDAQSDTLALNELQPSKRSKAQVAASAAVVVTAVSEALRSDAGAEGPTSPNDSATPTSLHTAEMATQSIAQSEPQSEHFEVGQPAAEPINTAVEQRSSERILEIVDKVDAGDMDAELDLPDVVDDGPDSDEDVLE